MEQDSIISKAHIVYTVILKNKTPIIIDAQCI